MFLFEDITKIYDKNPWRINFDKIKGLQKTKVDRFYLV